MSDRKKKEAGIPLPPELVREIKSSTKKRFFRNLSPSVIVKREEIGRKNPRLPRGIWWGIVGLAVFLVVGFAVSFFMLRRNISDEISSRADLFRAGVADLQNGDPSLAEQQFTAISESNNGLASFAGQLGFLFQGGARTITAFIDATKQFAQLSQELAALEDDTFHLWSGRGQSNVIAHLEGLRATLAAITTDGEELSSVMPSLANLLGGGNNYLTLQIQSEGIQKFLDVFIPWLSAPAPHHILIMLQNPSEIRPAGGFLGSYADVTIASGTIADVSVHDIADVDTAFALKVVPPKPLQLEVSRFRPADANWFFDFSMSASETLAFFNTSQLYASTTSATSTMPAPQSYFDTAIAVSPKVVEDLLGVTGPITVSSTKTTFTADNFLVQVQKIVQAGQASSVTYPKQVLRDLMAGLSMRLASSTSADWQSIIAMASNWAAGKDIMAYATDPNIENFLKSYGVAGDVYALPQNFNGDYLALVDANVNGGKSDFSIAEKVTWTSQIGADGTLTDNLIVSRKHNGNTSPYWWYRTQNQVYLQAFVPPGSLLTNESGGLSEKISPKVNYAASGYSTDPMVLSVESSTRTLFSYPAVTEHQEDGKTVFATWLVVKAGSSAQLSFDYTHSAFIPPAPGVVYQFIFEKQAGTNRSYALEVDAPLGYQFEETGLSSWTYKSDDFPGRMIVNLTLEKTTDVD